MEQYSARGKLLLSGEYAVMYGAKALAIPSIYGQHLRIKHGENKGINWQSLDYLNNPWFSASFNDKLEITACTDKEKAQHLRNLLMVAEEISGEKKNNFSAISSLDFPNEWGLGSSSTLIYLIASFFRIDPFKLFAATTNGSGYDIACAGELKPIIFHKNNNNYLWNTAELPDAFKKCYFIYLNKKQNSLQAISNFEKKEVNKSLLVDRINKLTDAFINAEKADQLQLLLSKHEGILSEVLGIAPVKERLFPDFNGSIKSLGAWGGDFIMALGEDVEDYFKEKLYPVIIPYNKMAAFSKEN